MIHQATRAISNALSMTNLKYKVEELNDSSYVSLAFNGEAGNKYTIRFISTDEDNDVSVRVFSICTLQGDKRVRILPALNFLNNKYRFAKFVCDKDGDVNLEYDFPVDTINPAACAEELVRAIAQIIDDAYPVMMKAIYGGD